jgi:hypothetical protein
MFRQRHPAGHQGSGRIPKRLDAVTDPNYAFWHSANFSNDGKTLLHR